MQVNRISKIIPRVDGLSDQAILYEAEDVGSLGNPTVSVGWNLELYVSPAYAYNVIYRLKDGQLFRLIDLNRDVMYVRDTDRNNKMYFSFWTTDSYDWPYGGAVFSYNVGSSTINMLCGSLTDNGGVFTPGYGTNARFMSLEGLWGVSKDGTIWCSDFNNTGFLAVKILSDGYTTKVAEFVPPPNVFCSSCGAIGPYGEVYVGVLEYNFVTDDRRVHLTKLVGDNFLNIVDFEGAAFVSAARATESGQIMVSCGYYNLALTEYHEKVWNVSPNGQKVLVCEGDPTPFPLGHYFVLDRFGTVYKVETLIV